MTHECTLKEAYIIKALDELQPDWRAGADVRGETKDKIRERVAKKYADIFDPDDSACITFKSIENTVSRIRKKLNIQTSREKFSFPNSQNPPVQGDLDSSAPKPEPSSEIEATAEPGEPSVEAESGKGLELGREPQQERVKEQEQEKEPEPEKEQEQQQEPEEKEEPEKKEEEKPGSEEVSKQQQEPVKEQELEKEPEPEKEQEQPQETEEDSDPNRNPKTAHPEAVYYCNYCEEYFKINGRTTCPACGSSDITYSDWHAECSYHPPKPLKEILTFCPCGCGYGIDPDDEKWYSPEEMEGKYV